VSPTKKQTVLPPPKKSEVTQNASKTNKNQLQNRFSPALTYGNFDESSNPPQNNNPVRSNLMFANQGDDDEDLIFATKKPKEEVKVQETKNEVVKKKNDHSHNSSNVNQPNTTSHKENFLDYNVNTTNKNNFFDEGDAEEEVLNKSHHLSNQPVTGEHARAKTPQNEKALNPESGATQNDEKKWEDQLF